MAKGKYTSSAERLEKKRLAERERKKRIKNDPVLGEELRRKERERYHRKKEQGKVIPMSQLSTRQRKRINKRNLAYYRAYLARKKAKKHLEGKTEANTAVTDHDSRARRSSTRRPSSPSEDPESQPPEISVSVKLEVEDDISEHEDDIMEQLENRKRLLEKDPIAIDTKRVKVEPDEAAESEEQPQYEIRQEPQTSQAQSQFLVQPQQSIQSQFVVPQPQKNKCPKHSAHTQQADNEPEVIPEFFMRVVVQNQTEILKILKQQVLLQDPNPEVLTFLRFLGAKLLRLPKSKRDEIQDKITDMVLLE